MQWILGSILLFFQTKWLEIISSNVCHQSTIHRKRKHFQNSYPTSSFNFPLTKQLALTQISHKSSWWADTLPPSLLFGTCHLHAHRRSATAICHIEVTSGKISQLRLNHLIVDGYCFASPFQSTVTSRTQQRNDNSVHQSNNATDHEDWLNHIILHRNTKSSMKK